MAATPKILDQAAPGAAVEAVLYTVPAAKTAVASVKVANRGAATTIRITLAIGGAATVAKQYIANDVNLPANGTAEWAVALGTGDVIRVQSASGNVTFVATGIEYS